MDERLQTIEQAWQEYAAAVVPKGAGPGQRHDLRCSFYAGAFQLFNMATGPMADMTDAKAMAALDALAAEFVQFSGELGAAAAIFVAKGRRHGL